MGIGLGIVLLVLGLILLTDAVDLPASIDDAIARDTLGWIFVVVGALAIALALLVNQQRSKTTYVEEHHRSDPPAR